MCAEETFTVFAKIAKFIFAKSSSFRELQKSYPQNKINKNKEFLHALSNYEGHFIFEEHCFHFNELKTIIITGDL